MVVCQKKRVLSHFTYVWLFLNFCVLLSATRCDAQMGLEGIIVEKYYITGPGDTLCSDSTACIPQGTTTYRIYVDMAPVYRLQAVYGVQGHEMRIATTTRFYNCPAADGITANDIHPNLLTSSCAMLDSWLSVGAAALDYQAVLKTEDDSLPSLALDNKHGFLKNSDTAFGIPLTDRDGMRFLRLQPAVNFFNMEQDLRLFDSKNASEVSGLMRTTDGAWASYGGAVGPQPENRVLIAQLTTDGVLSFELNIQLAVPGGGVEKFVARNPVDGETEHPALRFTSAPGKLPPQIELRRQDIKSVKSKKAPFPIEAKVYDEDGTIVSVDYYVNGKPTVQVNAPPYLFRYNGTDQGVWIHAVATDNDGLKAASSTMYIGAE